MVWIVYRFQCEFRVGGNGEANANQPFGEQHTATCPPRRQCEPIRCWRVCAVNRGKQRVKRLRVLENLQ